MAEQISEQTACPGCGADIRRGAMFCYSCGETLALGLPIETQDAKTGNGKELKSIDANKEDENNPLYQTSRLDKPISKPDVEALTVSNINESSDGTKANVKTAAELRKKARPPREKKQVEVVWEEPAEATNVWFVAVSIILTVFALGIVWAMLYIK